MKSGLPFCLAGMVAMGISAAAAADVPGASSTDQPFFAAFKTFCADTDTKPAAIMAAVIAAGGTRLPTPPFPMPPLSESVRQSIRAAGANPDLPPPPPYEELLWDVVIGGHSLTVRSLGDGTCEIKSRFNEESSYAAFRRWAGVAERDYMGRVIPDTKKPSYSFVFIDVKGRHHEMPTKFEIDYGLASVGPRTELKLSFQAAGASALLRFTRPEHCRPPSVYDLATGGCWCAPLGRCPPACPPEHKLTSTGQCEALCPPGLHYVYGQCVCRPPTVIDPVAKTCICPPGADCSTP